MVSDKFFRSLGLTEEEYNSLSEIDFGHEVAVSDVGTHQRSAVRVAYEDRFNIELRSRRSNKTLEAKIINLAVNSVRFTMPYDVWQQEDISLWQGKNEIEIEKARIIDVNNDSVDVAYVTFSPLKLS